MRSKDRIKPFLEELGKLWESQEPDWRFGQLIDNFIRRYGDPFFMEEAEFLEKMRDFLS